MKLIYVLKTLSAQAGEAVNEAVTAGGMKFGFDPEKFWKTLETMGKGMLGIFIVTGVLILSVALLNKFTSPKK